VALALAKPLDLIDLYPEERGVLLELLGSLAPNDWDRETECPAWSVKGIALHLLGDDLSLLSRQRDGAPPGVVVTPTGGQWDELLGSLDEFNERWVESARFFRPALIIELLRITGEWSHRWYTEVDPERRGEAVGWVSPEPAPYWLLAAREYYERWIHQLQIRRAVGRPGLTDEPWVIPAVAVAMRGFPLALAALPAEGGTTLTISVDAGTRHSWTLVREESTWSLHDGEPADPTARLVVDLETAAQLFSRGLSRDDAAKRIRTEGDGELGPTVAAGIAAFFGR
jgi:uncharacterized protein (TIGR03083 family)